VFLLRLVSDPAALARGLDRADHPSRRRLSHRFAIRDGGGFPRSRSRDALAILAQGRFGRLKLALRPPHPTAKRGGGYAIPGGSTHGGHGWKVGACAEEGPMSNPW